MKWDLLVCVFAIGVLCFAKKDFSLCVYWRETKAHGLLHGNLVDS